MDTTQSNLIYEDLEYNHKAYNDLETHIILPPKKILIRNFYIRSFRNFFTRKLLDVQYNVIRMKSKLKTLGIL